jgi:hypothetical protein
MHAGFPCLKPDLQRVMRRGVHHGHESQLLPELLDRLGGGALAEAIALLVRLGFGYVLRDSLLSLDESDKAKAFFDDNFVIDDPQAPGGRRYYQGRFLLRTRRQGDDMNVLLRFCPKPDRLFRDTPFGRALDPLAVVVTEALSEKEAERLEKDLSGVDLVIRFRDVPAILALVGRDEVNVVSLLLENVVQLTGNTGHLFKLGAIAGDIERALGVGGAH